MSRTSNESFEISYKQEIFIIHFNQPKFNFYVFSLSNGKHCCNKNRGRNCTAECFGRDTGPDPTMADNDFSFGKINQVFEGLYRLDKEGKPQLALAAEEPQVSEDTKVYTFTLRDAKWSYAPCVFL